MELNVALVILSSIALIMSLGAFGFALFAFIETQAQKRSTHTVMPVGNEMSLKKLEEDIEKLTGQGASTQSMQRDLNLAGLDVDDLV
jgi:hypothetical protein